LKAALMVDLAARNEILERIFAMSGSNSVRIAVAALLMTCSDCLFHVGSINLWPQPQPLSESTVGGDKSGREKLLLVDVSGILLDEDTRVALGLVNLQSSVTKLKSILQKAEDDEDIRAVLVRVNSPGGSVTASELLYHEIKMFRDKRKIPVYVLMMDLAASGGYYLSMAAERVYALPTTTTGSIGVILPMINFAGLMNRFGVKDTTVKSGPHKDMLSPFREPTEEDRVIAQSIINDYYQQFVDRVQAGRPSLKRDEILNIADGRVYTARQALEKGLIDGIRHMDEVVQELNQKAGGKELRIVTYRNEKRFDDNVYADASASIQPSAQVQPPAMYLWQGGMAPSEAFDNFARSLGGALSR